VYLPPEQRQPEYILDQWAAITDRSQAAELKYAGEQTERFLARVAAQSRA